MKFTVQLITQVLVVDADSRDAAAQEAKREWMRTGILPPPEVDTFS